MTQVVGGVIRWSTATIIAAIFLVWGFAPSEWLSRLWTDPPFWISHPITRIIILIIGVLLLILFLYKTKPHVGRPVLGSQNRPKRVPLIELRDHIAGLPGWEEIGEGLQYLDLVKAFREAAHEERFEVWGRKNTTSGMFQSDEILRKIPAEYWEYSSLDELRFPSRKENKELCTYVIPVSRRNPEDTYWDLEVERAPALEWAQHGAERYRGDEDRSSAASQKEIQKVSVTRDTKMHEALAYIESGSWGKKFSEYFMSEYSKTGGNSPVLVRQAALDGEIRIWGKSSQNGPYILIDADYWKIWQIVIFSTMDGSSKTELAEVGYNAGSEYYDLMVSRLEIEKKWPK